MKYKTTFTVIYSEKTGKILREEWEPLRRLFWPLPWRKLPGKPVFENSDELFKWFEENYPNKRLNYHCYGKAKSEH